GIHADESMMRKNSDRRFTGHAAEYHRASDAARRPQSNKFLIFAAARCAGRFFCVQRPHLDGHLCPTDELVHSSETGDVDHQLTRPAQATRSHTNAGIATLPTNIAPSASMAASAKFEAAVLTEAPALG